MKSILAIVIRIRLNINSLTPGNINHFVFTFTITVTTAQHRNTLACVLTALRSGRHQKPVSNIYHCGVARQKCCLRAALNKRCISQRKRCCTLIPLRRRPFPTSNRFHQSGEALRTQDQSVPERWDWGEGTGGN